MIHISKCHFKLMFLAKRTVSTGSLCHETYLSSTFYSFFTPDHPILMSYAALLLTCPHSVRLEPPLQLPHSYTFPSGCSPNSRAVSIKLLRSALPTPACMIAEGKFPSISTASFKVGDKLGNSTF